MANKFNITDFIKIASSGWTPDEFNKALDRIESLNQIEPVEPTEPSEPVEPTEPAEPVEPVEDEPEEPDERDNKIRELEEIVKNLQSQNVHQSVNPSNNKTDEDIVNEALIGLLS